MKRETNGSPAGQQRYPVRQPSLLLPFLLEHCRGKSRNNIKSMLSRGQIQVGGKTVTRHDHALLPGQAVTVLDHVLPPLKLPFPILYEDEQLLVIDKPAGLLAVSTGRGEENTAYRLLREYLERKQRREQIFIVHRLDRDTSGVLLFAKSHPLKLALQERWNELVQTRGYLAIVEGAPPQEQGTIHTFLREASTHRMYSGKPGPGSEEAITHYQLLSRKGRLSLLQVKLDTGKKNQIRVHLQELGCPVVGDKKYGARTNPLGRLGLHASLLELTHPKTGQKLAFRAPVPQAFSQQFPK